MRKTRTAMFVTALVLTGIAALTATYSRSQTPPGKKQGRGLPAGGRRRAYLLFTIYYYYFIILLFYYYLRVTIYSK